MSPLLQLVFLLFYLIYCYLEAFVRLFIPRTSKNVAGKVVLVTGAGHGIGRELALQLSNLGARIILWDINKSNNETVASEIEERGGFAKAYTVDVTDTDKIKNAARQVRIDVGHVDILINNAGILHGGALLKLREDDIRRLYEINTLSHYWTVREFLPSMIDRNDGHIVCISSMAGRVATAYVTDYAASKYAVAGFMEALRDEMRREGHKALQFSTVYPMFVDTGMARNIRSELSKAMPVDWVASVIIDGVCKNKKDIYIPKDLEFSFKMKWLCPQKFMDKFMETFGTGINPQYE